MDDGEECWGHKSVKHTIRDIKSERFVESLYLFYLFIILFIYFGVQHLKHLSWVMSAAGKPNLNPASRWDELTDRRSDSPSALRLCGAEQTLNTQTDTCGGVHRIRATPVATRWSVKVDPPTHCPTCTNKLAHVWAVACWALPKRKKVRGVSLSVW